MTEENEKILTEEEVLAIAENNPEIQEETEDK